MERKDLDFMRLVNTVCGVYKITSDELFSGVRYGNIPRAKWVLCYIMSILNYRNNEISYILSISESSVSKAVSAVTEHYELQLIAEKILKEYGNTE